MANYFKIIDTDYANRTIDPIRSFYALDRNPVFDEIFQNIGSVHITTGGRSIRNEGVTFRTEEKIILEYPPSFSGDMLENIAENISANTFLTHKANIRVPTEDTDVAVFNFNTYASDAFSYYNIRNEIYEDFTQDVNEKFLPNFCLGALWSRSEWQDTNDPISTEQRQYYTLFGEAPGLVDAQILADVAKGTVINNYEFDDEYTTDVDGNGVVNIEYEETIDYYKHLLNSGSLSGDLYIRANSHIYVDFNYNINDSFSLGNTPFFNRIRLPVVDKTTTIEMPNGETHEFDTFVNSPSSIVESFIDSGMSDKLIKSFRFSNSFTREFDVEGSAPTSLKVYDVLELFETITYGTPLTQEDEMYLRSNEQRYSSDSDGPFVYYLNKLVLLGKLRRSIKNNLKSFRDVVIEGRDHETEHIGFKVIKRRSGRETPIQTFYFLNRSGLEDFVDTQIKFDRVYTYEVIGMFCIYGTEYRYEEIDTSSNNLSFKFVTKPSVKIVELPFVTHTMRIVEPPPIVPEVTFYNEMNSRNKLKIRLEHQDGNIVDEYSRKPMRLFNNNSNYVEKLKQYFKSDDIMVKSGKTSVGTYEIYRLDYPPKSYEDFEDALLDTSFSSVVYRNGEVSKNSMFVDMIKHQQKYYYTFRTLTHRGNPSELSDIYVVEMYQDADETFLTYDIYNPDSAKQEKSIAMRKYIQILPNEEHIITNDEELLNNYGSAEAALSELKLGSDMDENLWQFKDKENYIKLRLESKNSGRKIDLNLYFDIKK